MAIASAPEVAGFSVHRAAGLARQLLVACSEGDDLGLDSGLESSLATLTRLFLSSDPRLWRGVLWVGWSTIYFGPKQYMYFGVPSWYAWRAGPDLEAT